MERLVHAKADNRVQFAATLYRVHGATKRRIALSKMIWIYRMPSVADHLYMQEMMEQRSGSVNGEYSVHFFYNPYNLLALVEQIFTQQHIFL